jgi:hypothetical protein
MTPAEEARFIALWNAGTETAEIGRQLGIPRGTVSSRAYTLVRQDKIQARPKGGNYPRQQARTRPTLALSETTEAPPVHTPVQKATPPGAVHNPVHTPPAPSPVSPDLSGALNALVERLSAIEETLKQGRCSGMHRCRTMHPCRVMHRCRTMRSPAWNPRDCQPRTGNPSAGISTCPGGSGGGSSGRPPGRGCPPANSCSACVAPGRRRGTTPRPSHDSLDTRPLPLLRAGAPSLAAGGPRHGGGL